MTNKNMRLLKSNSIFLIIIFVVASYLLLGAKEKKNPLPNIEIPIYMNAYEINKYVNNQIGRKEIFYKINIKFPAREVILFYENKFRKMGFFPYSEDGYGNRRWENFNLKTGNWESTTQIPARYIATWVDTKRKIRIVLFLRYEYDATNRDWKNKLLVNCSVQEFFEFKDMDTFNEEPKKRKQTSE
jgi:hypothetical protein